MDKEYFEYLIKERQDSFNRLNVLNDDVYMKLFNLREDLHGKDYISKMLTFKESYNASKKLTSLLHAIEERTMDESMYSLLNQLSPEEILMEVRHFRELRYKSGEKVKLFEEEIDAIVPPESVNSINLTDN